MTPSEHILFASVPSLPVDSNLVVSSNDSKPTFFLSECVLVYLQRLYSENIIDWITSNVAASFFLLYEQILPDDAFGNTMVQNLRVISIEHSRLSDEYFRLSFD